MAERKPISKKTRFEIFKRDGFSCRYCGAHPPEAVLEVDHIQAVANGGTNDEDNLVTACLPCNRGKAANPLDQVPQSLADKAAEVAEAEAQLEGYQEILRGQKDRIERDAWEVADVYLDHFSKDSILKADLQSIKQFVQKLGAVECVASMEKAVATKPYSEHSAFKYFCGICWTKIKNPNGTR